MMKNFLSKLILFCLIFNLFTLNGIVNSVSAADTDGTANLNLSINSNVIESSIVGNNFTYSFTLKNELTSDGESFDAGFILSLPDGVDFVSAGIDLGNYTRTIVNNGKKLYFFKTTDFLLKGSSKTYTVDLVSSNSANLLQNYDIKVLSYANDSIYGRGTAPDGAPGGTLDGGVDIANTNIDPTDLNFPDNIDINTDLTVSPYDSAFVSDQTKFIPFDVEKDGSDLGLIGYTHENIITIKGNSLGELKNFSLEDIIPSNRKFVGFTQTGGVSNIGVTYNYPNSGEVTLYMSGITVPTGTDLEIKYETLSLAFPISSYSGSSILLNTGSVILDRTSSINKVKQIEAGTWNNGVSDIPVDSTTLVPERTHNERLSYAILGKSVSGPLPVVNHIQQAVIGDLLTYTISLNVAKNVAFSSNGSGTYIEDIIPDGLSLSGVLSSVNNGAGNVLTFISSNVDADGDTTLLWKLNSGELKAGDNLVIKYEALVDGLYEGTGDNQFENTDTLINTANFLGTISDSGNNEEWGYTDSSLLNTTKTYSTSATVKAPKPNNKKYIVKITTPDNTVYDNTTGLPSSIPVGSEIQYGLVMAFPNVNFIDAKVIDALPLIVGPNDSVYDYSFQTGSSLKDINGNSIEINDDDNDGNADNSFNALNLTSTGWISETPANNIEFDLGTGTGNKTFSILFKVKVLDIKPSGVSNGLSPLKNVSFATINNDQSEIQNLSIKNVSLDLGVPELELTKTMSGTNIEAGSNIDYSVEIKNTGTQGAYIENLIDTLPDNVDLQNYTITGSGFVVTSDSLTQSGNILDISFDLSNGRSVLPINSSVKIDYTVKANSGLLINNQNKTNKVTLDYYASDTATSNGLNNYGPLEAESSFITKQPTIIRTLISTSESGTGSGNDVEIGEEAYFETIIKLPGGVYNNSSFEFTENTNLDFLTGSIVSNSGSLNFSSGATFSGSTVTFGTLTNSDLDPNTTEKIVFNSTFRPKIGASNGNKYTRGRFYYNSLNITKSKSIEVIQPNILINKSVNPTSGNAGDVLDYTVNINNNGNANAYDLKLNDLLDSRLIFITGSLVNNGFTNSENDFLSSTGITLDKLDFGTSTGITFQVQVNQNIAPDDIIPNTVDIEYSSLAEDNSINEKTYTGSSTVNFNVDDILLTHNIISTNNPDTGTGKFNTSLYDLAIGEEATYKSTITFPESTSTGMIVTQTLPTGYKFLTGSVLAGDLSNTLSGITINNNIITYTFNPITVNSGSGAKIIELESNLVVKNTAPTSGQQKGESTLLTSWDTSHSKSIITNLDIVEPHLTITKDYSISTGDSGDVAATTITITNDGTAPAYDLIWLDTQSSDVTSTGGYLSSSGATKLDVGSSITYSYNTTLNNTVTSGQILTGTASVDYTSSPGINSNERNYNSFDTDSIQVVVPNNLIATLDTNQNVAIGDVSSYTIKVPVAEGTTNTIKIEDLLPSGIAINTGSILVNHNSITLSGSYQPTFSSTGMVWDFSNIVNNNTNNSVLEEIVITFDTVLLNTSDNNSGDTKVHNVKAIYNSGEEKNATTNNLTVVEPNLGINITNSYNQLNKQVKYTYTIINTGTTTSYDLDLDTLLPSGVTYTGALNITNSGTVANLTKVGNKFLVDSLGVNTGNPLTFEIYADVDDNHNLGDNLTLSGNLDYTSQSGSYTSVISGNSNNIERNGDGGINDYKTSDNTSFIYQDAILDEEISVIDNNGGNHLGREDYIYTLTLTNTGNVDLTNISTNIDIPEYLSGSTFVLQNVPAGSTNNYSSTGGIYNNGKLTLSGINISVGNSVNIIYKIKSKKDTPDGTTITTTANVSNTPEGAIGGIISVPLTIIAPKFESTIIEIDDNGGDLYQNEIISHNSTIKNIGSSTGSNMEVSLTYNTGTVTYISGSLDFSSGSLVNTGSIVIDENLGKITFIITSIDPNVIESVTFKTKATGNIGDKVKTNLDSLIDEGFSSNSISNELEIKSIPSRGGSRYVKRMDVCNDTGGDKSGNYYDGKCLLDESTNTKKENEDSELNKEKNKQEKEKQEKEKLIKEQEKKEQEKKIKEEEDKKRLEQNILSLKPEYDEILLKEKRLKKILDEENNTQKEGFILPKILPKTGTPIEKRTFRRHVSSIEVNFPNKDIFRLAGKNNSSLDFWKQVLPEQDRNKDEYVVIPSNGLVIPVNKVPNTTTDFTKMISGKEINVNKYLKNGAMEYPNSGKLGKKGNKVIFGHSSYWKDDNGRYKTQFGKIIELDSGEEVWVYKKIDGEFVRYKYIVNKSFNTKPTNVSVLKQKTNSSILTLFTCTPIGGIQGRWIIQANYIDEEKENLKNELYGNKINYKYKRVISRFIQKINNINSNKREKIIVKIINKIDSITLKIKDKKIIDILKYLKLRLLKELFENKN